MARSVLLAIAGLALALPASTSARTWYITPDGTGDAPTIQAAIDLAVDGDEIVLGDGTFSGPGNRDLDCAGRAVTVRSAGGDPALTTVHCDGSAADPHRGFAFQSGEGAGTVIDGVTITGGFAPGLPESRGGAMYCGPGTAPTIRTCVLDANIAKFGGGAYCDEGSAPAFVDCAFLENHASDGAGFGTGGAVSFPLSAPSFSECDFLDNVADLSAGAVAGGGAAEEVLFTGCLFRNNQSANGGGAGYLSAGGVGSVRFEECRFSGNRCTNPTVSYGAALNAFRADLTLDGCVFDGNAASTGGAVFLADLEATLTGCSFQGNVAERSGGGAFVNQDARATFSGCTFVANESHGVHPDFGGGAVHTSTGTRTSFLQCVFVANSAVNGGGVYRTQHSHLGVTGCTFVGQSGAAIGFFGSGTDTLRHTIISSTISGPAILCSANEITVECCDIHDNAGGDAICGIDAGGNLSADPLFCDAENGDFTIQSDSPCAPPGVTGCGLVGALPVGCGPVAVEPLSWGTVKGMYR